MAILDYTLAEVTSRIILNLPTRFVKDETSNVYRIFQAISNAFYLNTQQIDELFRQTSLATVSSGYVDDYISDLSGIGRFPSGTVYLDHDETDSQLIERYKNTVYVYNSTKTGLTQICIDMIGNAPMHMYTGRRRGAYAGARYFYNEGSAAAWGSAGGGSPFTGYIEFSRRPNYWIIEELRKTIKKCRGFGIQIYLKYPDDDDLDVILSEGALERAELF